MRIVKGSRGNLVDSPAKVQAMSDESTTSTEQQREAHRNDYWRSNLRLVAKLLVVWFLVSYGCGILFVDELNKISLGGFKLGFWFAQQGSIYIFVVLIFIYVKKMNKIDRDFGVEEE